MIIQKDELTYQERNELELRYDGPIPPHVIADTIEGRVIAPKQSREEELRSLLAKNIRIAGEYLADVEVCKSRGHDGAADVCNRKAMMYLDMADACERELDALEAPSLKFAAE